MKKLELSPRERGALQRLVAAKRGRAAGTLPSAELKRLIEVGLVDRSPGAQSRVRITWVGRAEIRPVKQPSPEDKKLASLLTGFVARYPGPTAVSVMPAQLAASLGTLQAQQLAAPVAGKDSWKITEEGVELLLDTAAGSAQVMADLATASGDPGRRYLRALTEPAHSSAPEPAPEAPQNSVTRAEARELIDAAMQCGSEDEIVRVVTKAAATVAGRVIAPGLYVEAIRAVASASTPSAVRAGNLLTANRALAAALAALTKEMSNE